MASIIIGTTPTITYQFKIVSPSDFRTAFLTIKGSGKILIEKTLADALMGEDSLSWTLTQEETLSIGINTVKMMCNWVTYSGKRGASPETVIHVVPNHKMEVM